MMHHTFEHVADPRAVLASVRRLLTPNGKLRVRMPVMGTYAWRAFGSDWVQIDAPRHLALYTVDGFELLARQEGFSIKRLVFDSTGFQFWGSEMVRAGAAHGLGHDGRFSRRDLRRWGRRAAVLNRASDGDQAMYVLGLHGSHGESREPLGMV
jgi:Methyltransferase domain